MIRIESIERGAMVMIKREFVFVFVCIVDIYFEHRGNLDNTLTTHKILDDKENLDIKVVNTTPYFILLCRMIFICFHYFQLAELKSVFDRFAVSGFMTAPETCQALTEAGLVVPRRCACAVNCLIWWFNV
jgi:hypothetical protein